MKDIKKISPDEWTEKAVDFFRDDYKRAGYDIPEYYISWGFTSAGSRTTRVAGQAFHPRCSEDKTAHIFLNPTYGKGDEEKLLNIILHEIAHVTVGNEHGHKGPFIKVCKELGMKSPWTATRWTDEGLEKSKLVIASIGDFPRARFIKPKTKKQSTRLLKAICPETYGECGYTVRLSKKWAEQGLPDCPLCEETLILD